MDTQGTIILALVALLLALMFYIDVCKCEIIKHIDKKFKEIEKQRDTDSEIDFGEIPNGKI